MKTEMDAATETNAKTETAGDPAQTRVLARDIAAYRDRSVMVSGWVHRIRELGRISFILLRDRSGIIQIVCEEQIDLTVESVIRVYGVVASNGKAPGNFEVRAARLETLSHAATPLPYQPNSSTAVGIETILEQRILSLRNPRINACFRLQAAIIHHFARYMRSRQFTEIKSSKLVASGTEGGTGLFEVKYFDRSVFLAQSPQFYKQAMVASGMERVFEIGAAYRAEKHETARHLNEFISLDVEMGFIDDITTLMDLEVEILCAISEGVRSECGALAAEHDFPLPDPAALRRAPRIDYKEALKIIAAEGASAGADTRAGTDAGADSGAGADTGAGAGAGAGGRTRTSKRVFEITPEGERLLCAWAALHSDSDMVFVHTFPLRKRPFYTRPDGSGTKSFDCLFRGTEITTGGLRLHQYDQLRENATRFGLRPEDLSHYLDIFKYGCPPHGGFAIGLERLTQKFCNLGSVKEAALFPRDRTRTTP